jgi:hypothetical protein
MMSGTRRRVQFLALCALVLGVWATAAPLSAQAQTVSYTGSAQYAAGDYIFAERTRSFYLSNGLSFATDRLTVAASVPLIVQSSPWVSYSVAGGLPSGGPQQGAVGGGHRGQGSSGDATSDQTRFQTPGTHTPGTHTPGTHTSGTQDRQRRPGETIALPDTASYTHVGLGDPSLRLDLQLVQNGPLGLGVGLSASAKAPVADVDRGFGTGAWDGGLGLSLSAQHGTWMLLGDATHWWFGDMREVVLHNTVAYTVSVGRVFPETNWSVLGSVSGYTSEVVDAVDPPLQLGLGAFYRVGPGGSGLSASLSLGLTESAPDVSAGLGWQVSL